MIILTEEQAQQVRGTTHEGAALEPVLLNGGDYFLPESVLEDAAHALHHAFLATLPVRDLEAGELIQVEE